MNSKRQTNEPRDNRGGDEEKRALRKQQNHSPVCLFRSRDSHTAVSDQSAYVTLYLGLHLELIISYPHQDSLCES